MDSRARRNLSAINNQLHDVQRIMVQNIDDVLQRGTVLSGKLNSKSILMVNITEFPLFFRIGYKDTEFIDVNAEIQERCDIFEYEIHVC